jgi:glycine cleavage system aminomethyltransferase T
MATQETRFETESLGERHTAKLSRLPFYDPENQRLRR